MPRCDWLQHCNFLAGIEILPIALQTACKPCGFAAGRPAIVAGPVLRVAIGESCSVCRALKETRVACTVVEDRMWLPQRWYRKQVDTKRKLTDTVVLRVQMGKQERRRWGRGGGRKRQRFVCWLDALCPSNMLVYLRDGFAQTRVRAATMRQKLQIKLSISPSHTMLTSGQSVPVLTLCARCLAG